MSYVCILFTIGLIILIHEIGHFTAARLTGIPIERFSIGFGPKLYSHRGKHTEYLISLIPIGGYVLPETTEADFYKIPVIRRIVFSLGGPVANIFCSLLMLTIALIIQQGFSFTALFVKPLAILSSQTAAIVAAIPHLFSRPESISGIVGIVSQGGQLLGAEPLILLRFGAFLSLNLAIFNLLPIPALDGGKILLFLLEKIHPKLVKLHMPLALAGWGFIVLLMIYVTILDVQKLLA
jgi:regulator of sigma E protease